MEHACRCHAGGDTVAVVKDRMLFNLLHDFFKVYLPEQRGSSPHTVRSYKTAMDIFLDFIKEYNGIALCEITFGMLNSNSLTAFLDKLESKGCGVSTRNLRLNCIRAFFSYAAKIEPMAVIHKAEINKVPLKKNTDPVIVEYMSENAVTAIMQQPDTSTKKGFRDQFMLRMFYDTAARIQEILDIRLCDLRFGKTPIVILRGKGGKTRTVPLAEKTVEQFNIYKTVFHSGESLYSEAYIFYVVQHGCAKPMSERTVRKFMTEYADEARKKCSDVPNKIYPHLWRHSRAMHLYRHGMDLTLVSQWLGHANLETTLVYAHADTEQKRKAIEAATSNNSPLKTFLNADRFVVDDDEMLKRLYGLR